MKFNTKYEAYNSSWGKYLGLGFLPSIVGFELMPRKEITQINFDASFTERLPSLIFCGISTSYFIHNLYDQYQHNKSLEAQLKVEIDGEVKTINASPNYFDAYTTYNMLATVGSLSKIIGIGIGSQTLCNVSFIPFFAAVISKLVSLGGDYQEYNFTDENGNSISPEMIAWGDVLHVEYLNS